MIEAYTTVDWLRISGKMPNRLTDMLPQMIDISRYERIKPLPYYTHACKLNPGGRIDWNEANSTQGALVTYSGADLSSCEAYGIDKTYLVEHAANRADLRVTRIDLAIDVLGVEDAPNDVMQEWAEGRVKTRAREVNQIHGYCKQMKRTGNTVYVGASREAENYCRVYNKGAQKKLDMLWSRIEMELKGDKAGIAARAVAGVGVAPTAAAALFRYVDCPSLEWWKMLHEILPLATKNLMAGENHNKKQSTWLMTQALPAVEKAIAEDNQAVIERILMSIKKWDNWSV